MLIAASMAAMLEPLPALVARVLVVDGGGGGDRGGGGDGGSGGNGGLPQEIVAVMEPGDYTVIVAPTAPWASGTSANLTPSSITRTTGPAFSLAGTGTAKNTRPAPADGDTSNVLLSDITGSPVAYGAGGHAGNPVGTGGGANGATYGTGGAGGNGDDTGGATNDGGAGASGVVMIRYPGPQRFTGGTVSTVGTETLHLFAPGVTNFTIPF